MRIYKNALIFLVISLMLFGGYGLYYFWDDKNANTVVESGTTEPIQTVLNLKKEIVKSIDVKFNNSSLLFENKNNNFTLLTPENINIDKDVLNNLINTSLNLTAEKKIGTQIDEIAQFGLLQPKGEIILNLNDNTSKKLLIGDKSPSNVGYYVMSKDNNTIWLVETTKAENLLVDLKKIINKSVFEVGKDQIDRVLVQKSDKVITEIGYEIVKDKKLEDKWNVIKPREVEADSDLVSKVLDDIKNIRLIEYVTGTEKDGLSRLFENPFYVIKIGINNKPDMKLLLATEKIAGKEIYAKFEGSSDIFLIDSQTIAFKDGTIKDVTKK